MTDNPDRLPEDLGAKLALLTTERPEPADPAVPVRLRIRRRQVRRRTAAAAISAAAVTVAVVVASSVLGSMRSAEPGVATPSPSPTPQTRTQNLDFRFTPLPQPWSTERAFTTQPDSLKYAPAFYVAHGSIPNEGWAVASTYSEGCLVVTDEGPEKSFGGIKDCFYENWRPGQLAQYRAIPAEVPNISSPLNLTMVMGAVSAEARKVRITAGGKSYDTEAVGTPNSSRFRFFAVVIDQAESGITAVTPLTATGEPAAGPR